MHIQGFLQSQSSLICFCGVEFLLQTFAIKCVIENYVYVARFRLSFECSYELRIKVEFSEIPRKKILHFLPSTFMYSNRLLRYVWIENVFMIWIS